MIPLSSHLFVSSRGPVSSFKLITLCRHFCSGDRVWRGADVCPHLAGSERENGGRVPACWHQWHEPMATSGSVPVRRPGLHYTALRATPFIITVPATIRATCNSRPVTPQYQVFLLACRDGASECSDEEIDCPASADLGRRWWNNFAETVVASPSPLDRAVPDHASDMTSFPFSLPTPLTHYDGRTLHAVRDKRRCAACILCTHSILPIGPAKEINARPTVVLPSRFQLLFSTADGTDCMDRVSFSGSACCPRLPCRWFMCDHP